METEKPKYSSTRADAVCFAAGVRGAPMAAGVIHAYLAADRQPPKVVAGISVGALSAAAMQRCYQELEKAKADPAIDDEVARWMWFRRYLSFLGERPLEVIWNCIPDPSDFLSDLPPVIDPSTPSKKDESASLTWQESETQARRALFVMVKLGQWIARIPVSIRSVTSILVHYVRFKEKYPRGRMNRLSNIWYLSTRIPWTLFRLAFHVCRSPKLIWESQFPEAGHGIVHPLLGWKTWLLCTVWSALVVVPFVFALILFPVLPEIAGFFGIPIAYGQFLEIEKLLGIVYKPAADTVAQMREQFQWLTPWLPLVSLLFLFGPMGLVLARASTQKFSEDFRWLFGHRSPKPRRRRRALEWFLRNLFTGLRIEQALFEDYFLKRQLSELFRNDESITPNLTETPMPLLLVSAPLQVLHSIDKSADHESAFPTQLWPNARKGEKTISIVEALRTAMAIPGLFKPRRVESSTKENELHVWIRKLNQEEGEFGKVERLDLVDGAVVRQNPLPALFSFIEQNPDTAKSLGCSLDQKESERPVVYMVYSDCLKRKDVDANASEEPPDIVDAVQRGLRLQRRRDSRLEVVRTNFISNIALHSSATGVEKPGALAVQVEELAPEEDFTVRNPLRPTEDELLKAVASSCRTTLGNLYSKEIEEAARHAPVWCPDLLRRVTTARNLDHAEDPKSPGLPEVCKRCTRILVPGVKPGSQILSPAMEAKESPSVAAMFPALTGTQPRIVVLLNGGVFRGSFHIGLVAALHAARVKPDLIVGASVGTLMGLALGAMAANPARGLEKLHKLVDIFMRVDQTVALTKPLKAAARDLGVRGRYVELSPRQFTKLVHANDSSGAPQALMDAISRLFVIPVDQTQEIAAAFIAGKVTKATYKFLQQLKDETIVRLGIKHAVIGDSLLADRVAELLDDPDRPKTQPPIRSLAQPFCHQGIAFFATTVNLTTEWLTVLGSDLDKQGRSYDVVQAALASSAFPGVFAPKRDSDLFPGIGSKGIFYGDGGTFDNLPFVPAIEVLRVAQQQHMENSTDWRAFLERRSKEPDLFLVGALNARQENEYEDAARQQAKSYDFLTDISARAGALADNEKIFGFQRASKKIDNMLGRLYKHVEASNVEIPEERLRFFNGIVNAAVVPVFPADKEHLNGTFQFCSSVGMDRATVKLSIADGCFQTLAKMQEAGNKKGTAQGTTPTQRSFDALREIGKIPLIIKPKEKVGTGECPFFATVKKDDAPRKLMCPFYEASLLKDASPESKEWLEDIYGVCTKDPKHTSA